MAFFNNWGDLWHDVTQIAQGHNPMNNPPPVPVPAPNGPQTGFPTQPNPHSTGQTAMPQTDPYGNPLDPGADPSGDGTDSSSGSWDWLKNVAGDVGSYLKDHAGDILKTGGTAANSYLDYITKQKAIQERQREFDAQNQIAQGYQGMTAASQLNRAPLADKGQYLALNYAAPTAFKPRDYTQGMSQIQPGQQAQGGAAAQLAANAQASANYKPGAGGVNTDTLNMILSRIGLKPGQSPTNPAGATPTPGASLPPGAAAVAGGTAPTTSAPPVTPHSVTTNYGGQQYTPEQWAAYLAQHPEMKTQGY